MNNQKRILRVCKFYKYYGVDYIACIYNRFAYLCDFELIITYKYNKIKSYNIVVNSSIKIHLLFNEMIILERFSHNFWNCKYWNVHYV